MIRGSSYGLMKPAVARRITSASMDAFRGEPPVYHRLLVRGKRISAIAIPRVRNDIIYIQ